MRGQGQVNQLWKVAPSRHSNRAHGRYFGIVLIMVVVMLAGNLSGVLPAFSPSPVGASHSTMKLPVPSGAAWVIGQGYNTRPSAGTHWNCDPATLRDQPTRTESCRAHYQYKFSFDLARADGSTAGQPVLAPADGTIRWIDLSTGGMSIDLGDGYAFAFFHTNLVAGLDSGQRIQRGQRLATVAGPGLAANGGWPHLHVTLWQTSDGGNWSRIAVPFTDDHAFEGYDFPNLGESAIDQYRGRTIYSTNQELGGASPSLTAPVLQSPATGTSFRTYSPRPTLTWSPVSGATQYQVVVNDGALTSTWLSGTVWTMPVLTNGQYAWQVRARTSAGTGPLSPKWVLWVDTTDATPPPTAPPSGSLAINATPYSGQVGTSFSITGSGFGASETVRFYLDSASSTPFAAAQTQSTGSFATTVTLPNATAGFHRFVVRGMSTGRITNTGFRVSPSLERTPYSGTPGTAVTVTVKGFGAYEAVRLTWETSSGTYLGTAGTNGAGTGVTTIRIPHGSEGWHDYVGIGSKSGARGYGAIKITSPPSTGGGGTPTGGQIVGTGSYRITATREGLVGGTTSSGHVIVPDDHFVSLPACTATSCSWLTPGSRHDTWGLRVECGSRCYVRVKNVATGACSVAPIYDVGPWFTNDDWWNPTSSRTLNNLSTTKTILPQAYTGADAARDGGDVGYGRAPSGIGISNKGYEVGNRASLDIADGTWVDIGFAMGAGIAPNGVIATMLWQSGEDPLSAARACGQSSPNSGKGSTNTPTPSPLPPPPAAPAPTTPVTLTSSASWVKVGQTVTLTGIGYKPGERVAIQWDGTLTVRTVYANTSGGFAFSLAVPNGAYGSHSFYARGGTTGRSANVALRIGATVNRTPTGGTPGTRVLITVAGFGAYERVRLTWNGASGTYLGTVSTNGQGTGTGTVVIPNDSAGWHDYAGTGNRSGARGFGAIQVQTAATTPIPTSPTSSLAITSSPRAGTPGSSVSVSVKGFLPREALRISWGSDNEYFGSIQADGSGSRSFAVPLPVRAQGVAILSVKGASSGRAVYSAFIIKPRMILSPDSGSMRTDVTVTGLGFSANQTAYVVWRPSGQQGSTICVSRTNASGTFRCDFVAPATSGTGVMYVTGMTGSVGATTTFRITDSLAAAEVGVDDPATESLPEPSVTPDASEPRVNMPTPASGERILRGREAESLATGTPTPTAPATPGVEDGEATATAERGLRDAATEPATANRSVREPEGTLGPAVPGTPVATTNAKPEVDEPRSLRTPAPGESPAPDSTEARAPAEVDVTPSVESTAAADDRSLRTLSADGSPSPEDPATAELGGTSTPPAAPDDGREIRTEPIPVVTEESADDALAAPTPVVAPTSVPTEVPAETPTAIPTELPTETPLPIRAEVATEAPVEIATEIPELIPTVEPTTDQILLTPASDVSLEVAPVADAGTPVVLESSVSTLPVGGPESATAYLTFQVEGISAGTVVDASLFVTGAGEGSGSSGVVTVLPGVWVDEWSATMEAAPAPGAPVVNAIGGTPDPIWLTPGVESVVDVTGTVSADGTMTFVIAGTPDTVAGIASRESGTPPRLALTIVRQAA